MFGKPLNRRANQYIRPYEGSDMRPWQSFCWVSGSRCRNKFCRLSWVHTERGQPIRAWLVWYCALHVVCWSRTLQAHAHSARIGTDATCKVVHLFWGWCLGRSRWSHRVYLTRSPRAPQASSKYLGDASCSRHRVWFLLRWRAGR